ncbi:MAG: DUF1298 domain-containing protein [Rhodocyclaceae bacterium]|nr:DUF1298 domain-containing protein [Rhodocyclaceae bacterium]
MRQVSPMEWSLLLLESPRTPFHLCTLVVFDAPPGAAPDFARQLHQRLQSHTRAAAPFNFQLAEQGAPVRATPAWREIEHIKPDYHLPYVVLAEPRPACLHEQLARLEAAPLDRSHPLWQCVFIDGLGGGRFAWFIKLHECLLDVLHGLKRFTAGFSAEASDREARPFWTQAAHEARHAAGIRLPGLSKRLAQQVQALSSGYGSLGAAIARSALLARQTLQEDAPAIPAVPPGTADRHDCSGRMLRTYTLSEANLARLCAAAGAGSDSVLLAILGGAVRRHLLANGALPAQTLTACVPVDVARLGRSDLEFRLSAMVLPLATDLDDAAARLSRIAAAEAEARRRLCEMPLRNLETYTGRLLLPFIVRELSYDDDVPPLANLSYTRLPSVAGPCHFGLARAVETYQLPSLLDGQFLGAGVLKFVGQYCLSLLTCTARADDADALVAALSESCEELAEALQVSWEDGGADAPHAGQAGARSESARGTTTAG